MPIKPIEYQSPSKPVETGKAPGLQSRLLSDVNGTKTYVLIFAKGDEVLSGLTDFANQNKVQSAHFSAIGAFQRATTAWFDPAKKQYRLNPIEGPVELVSLLGDIAVHDGKPTVHAHMAVGHPDGRVEGGHLINAYVFPTVELFMTVYLTPLYKKDDAETDLNFIDPAQKSKP
ncbi:DNA-binding protein [Spirosoma rhododendri]|uniref:DNA-binding protein n=2 Tax=Spirosoma rhododendri TaxID=2728024 RepID=A0A7L5DT69_9BACT|nr:DNA-binding protein [Spirosoma rhododendri]